MQRPRTITVFAVLNMIWAAFGFLCIPFGVLGMVASNDPYNNAIRESGFYTVWTWFFMVIGLLGSGILLATGIGFLKLRPWSRLLALYYSAFSVVIGLLGSGIDTVCLYLPLMEQASSLQGPEAMSLIFGVGLGVIITFLALIYYIALFFTLTRPHIASAFKQVARVS